MGLPPSFTSLYRLVLRACAASVLQKNAARKQLRLLFRPVFDAAARVITELQSNELSGLERMRREHFLNTFQQQLDGTLSFLVNSAQYRGIPHRTISNMVRLQKAHAFWVHGKYYSRSKKAWNPKAAVAAKLEAPVSHRRRKIEQMESDRVHERCWDAFGEVVRMAEGRHNLSLGRLYLKPWSLERH